MPCLKVLGGFGQRVEPTPHMLPNEVASGWGKEIVRPDYPGPQDSAFRQVHGFATAISNTPKEAESPERWPGQRPRISGTPETR